MFAGVCGERFSFLASLQFVPAVLRAAGEAFLWNGVLVSALVLVTLLFGRVYCSVLCPLGIWQDAVIRARRSVQKRHKFRYHKSLSALRYSICALFWLCAAAGWQVAVAVIEPYSAYGRIVRSVMGQNGGWVLAISLLTLGIVSALAWLCGREWCSGICPVGTTLGLFAKAAPMRIRVDEEACAGCGLCSAACKASAIDPETRKVDASRCVVCLDCLDSCRHGALRYGRSRKQAL